MDAIFAVLDTRAQSDIVGWVILVGAVVTAGIIAIAARLERKDRREKRARAAAESARHLGELSAAGYRALPAATEEEFQRIIRRLDVEGDR